MSDAYLMPCGYGEDEHAEKRSRFIGQVWPVTDEEQAVELIRRTREARFGAAHNPYAYIIRDGGFMRYSDDGEPQGTAGLPILDVFRREGLTNCLCVVTRFFGGTLLGAPGLTRAFAKAAKIGLVAAGVSEMRLWSEIELRCPYHQYEMLRLALIHAGGTEQDSEFAADVVLKALLPAHALDAFDKSVLDATAGAVRVLKTGDRFMGVRVK